MALLEVSFSGLIQKNTKITLTPTHFKIFDPLKPNIPSNFVLLLPLDYHFRAILWQHSTMERNVWVTI